MTSFLMRQAALPALALAWLLGLAPGVGAAQTTASAPEPVAAAASAAPTAALPPAEGASQSAPATAAPAPLSLSARKVYEQARSQLVQIRTLLKGRASQTSVGSGFVVTREGHIVTNFHVV